MNKRQKELLRKRLDDEQKVLDDIKATYKRALAQVDGKIADLLAREDLENLQSIVYQVNYQNALKAQISAALDMMNAEQFTTISDYLAKCYENGFIGSMYDFAGQGIPFVFPLDAEQISKAVVLDSKISEGLYKRLGFNVAELKKSIRQEVSRGVSAALSFHEISRNVSNSAGVTMKRSYTIARTEGHRITEEATYQAQVKAINNGANVVKQWDATLDKRTRPAHSELDGQLRNINEPFEWGGYETMYPSGFGIASLDINCRCSSLQRATWALDKAELETLKERANYYGLDKANSFEEFKEKYMEAVKE